MKLLSRKELFETSVKDLFKDVYEGDIDLSSRFLTKLPDNLPDNLDGHFLCNDNKLTTLEGCPITVTKNFSCRYNQLKNLIGCPTEVDGDFDCSNQYNGIDFTIKDVRDVCKVKGNIYV